MNRIGQNIFALWKCMEAVVTVLSERNCVRLNDQSPTHATWWLGGHSSGVP
jgi:hypothetical protein